MTKLKGKGWLRSSGPFPFTTLDHRLISRLRHWANDNIWSGIQSPQCEQSGAVCGSKWRRRRPEQITAEKWFLLSGANSSTSSPQWRAGDSHTKEPEGGRGASVTDERGTRTPPVSNVKVPKSSPSPLSSSQCCSSKLSRRRWDGSGRKQQKQNTLYSESVPYTKSSKSDLRLCHILCLSWQAAEVELHDPAVCGVCEQEQASLALKSFIRRKTTQLRYQSLKARLNTHLSSGGGGGAARTQTVISLNWQLIWASVRLIALIFLQDLNCSVCCRRVHVGRVGATSPRGLHDAAH